jgi:hypothetical protein
VIGWVVSANCYDFSLLRIGGVDAHRSCGGPRVERAGDETLSTRTMKPDSNPACIGWRWTPIGSVPTWATLLSRSHSRKDARSWRMVPQFRVSRVERRPATTDDAGHH